MSHPYHAVCLSVQLQDELRVLFQQLANEEDSVWFLTLSCEWVCVFKDDRLGKRTLWHALT